MDTYTRRRSDSFRDWIKSTTSCGDTPTLVSRAAFVNGYDRGYARCQADLEELLERMDIAEAETTALERPTDAEVGTRSVDRSDEG